MNTLTKAERRAFSHVLEGWSADLAKTGCFAEVQTPHALASAPAPAQDIERLVEHVSAIIGDEETHGEATGSKGKMTLHVPFWLLRDTRQALAPFQDKA